MKNHSQTEPKNDTFKLPDQLWHGTSMNTARLVARTGVLGMKNEISLTDGRKIATHFANKKSSNNSPVLISVPKDAVNLNALSPDAVLLLAPLHRPSPYGLDPNVELPDHQIESAFLKAESETWKNSLDWVSSAISKTNVFLDSVVVDTSPSKDTPEMQTLNAPYEGAGPVVELQGKDMQSTIITWWQNKILSTVGTGKTTKIETTDTQPLRFLLEFQVSDIFDPNADFDNSVDTLLENLNTLFDGWSSPLFVTGKTNENGLFEAFLCRFSQTRVDFFEKTLRHNEETILSTSCRCEQIWIHPSKMTPA